MPWDSEFWTQTIDIVQSNIAGWLPGLLAAIILLIVGWLVALLCRVIVSGLLRRLGLDRLAERTGISRSLADMNLGSSFASLLGRVVYWLILLIFIMAAIASLGLDIVTEVLSAFVGYIPNVIAAALILLLGGIIARLVGDTLGAFAIQSGISNGPLLGLVVRYTLLTIAVILALEQLNLKTSLLNVILVVLIAAFSLALALAFGLGNRELARHIMAGFHVKELFSPGQRLTVRNHTGRLVSIGAATSILETETGRISIPNDILLNEEVLIASADEDTA